MYLIYCAFIFLLFANLSKNKIEWFTLAVLSLLIWCNKEYFDNTEQSLYYIRAFLAFIAAQILMTRVSKLGLYQSFIQFLIISSYAALAYDVANKEHILIYNDYTGVIHGLVACQFIGVIPELWSTFRNIGPVSNFSDKLSKRIQKI